MQFCEVFWPSNVIDRQVRVKFDHFSYFKVKLESVVNLGCPVLHGGYLKGKLESLPLYQKKVQLVGIKRD